MKNRANAQSPGGSSAGGAGKGRRNSGEKKALVTKAADGGNLHHLKSGHVAHVKKTQTHVRASQVITLKPKPTYLDNPNVQLPESAPVMPTEVQTEQFLGRRGSSGSAGAGSDSNNRAGDGLTPAMVESAVDGP